ncbi:MAG: tripartite tricarboxylate transporter TctB family protein [Burkholderiales bacterium]
MRAGFLAAVLVAAGGYAWIAFAELAWLSSAGRLGPGFFPRVVGVALVALCAWSLAAELRRRSRERIPRHWRVTAALALLSALFVAALEPLGGLLAMVAYLAAALVLLNRRRTLQNVLLAALLPLALYLVFRVWLNAAVPRGPFGF